MKDPKVGQACLDLRDTLCPEGIAGTLRSYTDEAGAAEMLIARLSPEQKKLLKSIKLRGPRDRSGQPSVDPPAGAAEVGDDRGRRAAPELSCRIVAG